MAYGHGSNGKLATAVCTLVYGSFFDSRQRSLSVLKLGVSMTRDELIAAVPVHEREFAQRLGVGP